MAKTLLIIRDHETCVLLDNKNTFFYVEKEYCDFIPIALISIEKLSL